MSETLRESNKKDEALGDIYDIEGQGQTTEHSPEQAEYHALSVIYDEQRQKQLTVCLRTANHKTLRPETR